MQEEVPVPVSAETQFAAVCAAQLERPEVAEGRMFGSTGLKVGGKVFAMLVRGELVVKLPRERVEALVAGGEGHPFDPGHGRLMKEWVALSPTDANDWLALADDAREFVASGSARA